MDLAQGKGVQGPGIGNLGVVDGRLHERVLHRQPSHLGGATDDLGDPLRWQGGQRHLQERCVQAGGGLNYLLDPGFGYIAGFLPAAWLSGRLARQPGMDNLLSLTGAALLGLLVLQVCGLANLLLGGLVGRWNGALPQLLVSYSFGPLLPQLLLCCAVAVLALPLRRLLLLES